MDILYKLSLNLLNWGEPRFRTKVNHIVTAMTTEPMLTLVPDLPATVPTRAFALTAVGEYNAAEELAEDGSKAAIAARKEKRAIMEGIVKDWAPVLELAAKNAGSLEILENCGYDLRHTPQPVPQPLPATELKVCRSEFNGEIDGHTKAVLGALGYEGQYCLGPATAEANWQTGFFSHGTTHLKYTGLTPGQMYSFRLRVLGRDGWSAWSTVVQLMAV